MLTGRASDIFEIRDEPLGDDDPRETAESPGDDIEQAGASSAASARTRSRLLAFGCLITGIGALVAVLPRDGQRRESPVETHASAPSQRDAHEHVRATRAPRILREVRKPDPTHAASQRTSARVLKRVARAPTTPAPSGADHAGAPPTLGSAPSDARQRVLAEPYEEFGFER